MARNPIIPPGMEGLYESFEFAPAVRTGDFVVVSGQIGVGDDGGVHRTADEPRGDDDDDAAAPWAAFDAGNARG